jgi:elongation factor P
MLNYNEITPKKYIVLDGEPYEVVSSLVSRKQANKPVNKTKIKSLISGKVIEKVFHVSDKAKEADMDTKNIKYLYENRGEYWFCDENKPSDRFNLTENILGSKFKFIKQNSIVDALVFSIDDDEKIIGIKLPIKVDLKVTESAPAVKGNTVSGGSKQITVETGATLSVPMFINEGDIIRVNTDNGEYAERVDKK